MKTKQYSFNGLAGCVLQQRVHETDTLIGLYHAKQAGIDSDPGWPWATVCEDHSQFATHSTLAFAKTWARTPLEWCEVCGKQANKMKKQDTSKASSKPSKPSKKLQALAKELEARQTVLTNTIASFNESMSALYRHVEVAEERYNETIHAIDEFYMTTNEDVQAVVLSEVGCEEPAPLFLPDFDDLQPLKNVAEGKSVKPWAVFQVARGSAKLFDTYATEEEAKSSASSLHAKYAFIPSMYKTVKQSLGLI